MIILGDDGMRSRYVPPKPTVKILKRPQRDSQGSGDGPIFNGDKPKQPIKSLKQREQEYAEARKRILGEERSPEEQQQTAADQSINKIQPQDFSKIQAKLPGTFSPLSGGNLSINIERMPTGPDGTRGFNVRR